MVRKLSIIYILLFLAVVIVVIIGFASFQATKTSDKNGVKPNRYQPVTTLQKTGEESANEGDWVVVNKVEDQVDFLKKDVVNGKSIYYLKSEDENRPNLLITEGQGEEERTVFSRTIRKGLDALSISTFEEVVGQPEKVIKSSSYYGLAKEIYLYPSLGVSVVVDPSTSTVLEETSFPPTTIDGFLDAYGKYL